MLGIWTCKLVYICFNQIAKTCQDNPVILRILRDYISLESYCVMSTPPTFSGRQLSGRENRAHSNCRNSRSSSIQIFKKETQTQLVVTLPFGKGSRWNRRHNKNPAHRLNSKSAWFFTIWDVVRWLKHRVFQLRNDSIWGKQNPLKSHRKLEQLE